MAPRKAVVLAAGAGRRLGGATRDLPKPLVEVAGRSILERSLAALAEVGVSEAAIVVGYRAERIVDTIGPAFRGIRIAYVVNERYETTNDVYSLWLARAHLDDDAYLVEADVLVSPELLRSLDHGGASTVAVTPYDPDLRNVVARLDADRARVLRLLDESDPDVASGDGRSYTTISVFRFRQDLLRELVTALDRFVAGGNVHDVYETVLDEVLAGRRGSLEAVDCTGLPWHEVDDTADLLAAEFRFSPPQRRLPLLRETAEGAWRHGVTDHSYARNVHFPAGAARIAFEREVARAIVHRPSGQATLAALAASVTGEAASRLAVAPGVRDLLTAALRAVGGRGLVVTPAPGELAAAPGTTAHPLAWIEDEPDLHGLVAAADRLGATIVALASPDDERSTPLPKDRLVEVARTLARRGSLLFVDETLVELLADPAGSSLAGLLDDLPSLVLVRDFGAASGFAGTSVAVAATADDSLAAVLRADVARAGVGAAGEALLRLLPRQRTAFADSLDLVRADVSRLATRLAELPGVTVREPRGATVLVRPPEPWTAEDVVHELLAAHDVLLGTGLEGTYLRVASCGAKRDDRLLAALSAVLGASVHGTEPAVR